MAVTLPINPSVSSATMGKDYLLYVNIGTAAVPVWQLIGGQRSSSVGRSADSVDVACKTSNGWAAKKAGLRSWSVDLDSLVILDDTGYQVLDQAFMTGVEINVRLVYPDATYQDGWGSLTDFSLDTPHDGEASAKGTIDGNGALSSRIVDAITPLVATMSKAAAADKTFSITPTSAVLNSVKNVNADINLTLTTHYTYATGALVIKGTYLTTLSVGVYVFTIDVQNGNDVSVTITITA